MLVQSSWAEVEPLSAKLGEAFYKKLFELQPELERLFEGDIRKQGETLMGMISMAVELLDHQDTMQTALGRLGTRHAGYGVRAQHFAPFKQSLMWALERVLGPTFDGDLREAWDEMFELMARLMGERMMGGGHPGGHPGGPPHGHGG